MLPNPRTLLYSAHTAAKPAAPRDRLLLSPRPQPGGQWALQIGRRLPPLLKSHPAPAGLVLLAGTNDVLAAHCECTPPLANSFAMFSCINPLLATGGQPCCWQWRLACAAARGRAA